MRRLKNASFCLTLMLLVMLQMSAPALAGNVTVKGHIEGGTAPSTYTITYDSNGGEGGMSETVSSSTYTLLNENSSGISNSGYSFYCWNTATDGSGTTYKAGDVIALTGDLTLYAQWITKEEFRIIYDPNGGSGRLTVIIEVIGGTYNHTVLSADEARISRQNYSFIEWNTEPDGNGVCCQPGDLMTITGSITLYAQWNAWHLHYVNGYEDDTFRPENDITRAEAAQMICNLMQINGVDTTILSDTPWFPDVKSGIWYYNAVTYLTEQGIIEGYEDGTYRPEDKITRAEFTALIARYAELTVSNTSSGFSDVLSGYWASGYICAAVSDGYVDGYDDGTFRPENKIIRAEVVTMLNRLDGRDVDTENYTGLTMPFSDVTNKHWAYDHILEASVDHEIHYK